MSIDINKLKQDFADGRAVNPKNILMLIAEVERLQEYIADQEKAADEIANLLMELTTHIEAADDAVWKYQQNYRRLRGDL